MGDENFENEVLRELNRSQTGISTQIARISGNVSDALTAIAAKGVTVPQGANSDDLADLIGSIQTGGGTPSATQHTILFEFEDTTSTSITAYYDSTFISDAIRATTPTTYNNKTVTLAQLDGTTWYEPADIPLSIQLIDYNAVLTGYAIDSDGNIITSDAWNCVTDYTPIDPTMTFSFKCRQYATIGFYDKNKNPVSIAEADEIKESAEDYVAFGYLTPSIIPLRAAYVVLCGNTYGVEDTLSLIRTA